MPFTPLLLTLATFSAQADGMPPGYAKRAPPAPARIAPPPVSVPPQTTSGYYGRLDTGWSWNRLSEVGSSYIIGAGVGYQFSPHLRSDVTLGYRGKYNVDADMNIGGAPRLIAIIVAWLRS